MEQKILHCKSAVIISSKVAKGRNSNILQMVKECHQVMVMKERQIDEGMLGDYHVSQDFKLVDEDIFLHIVKANKNRPAAMVQKPKPTQKTADTIEMAAPKDADFLNHECFVYFFGDHVIYLNEGISSAALAKYISDLVARKNFIQGDEKIEFYNLANVDALKKIRTQKIKSLTVGARLDKPTWLASAPEMSDLSQAISSLIFQDTEEDQASIDDYKYSLTISNKGKISPDLVDPLTEKGASLYNELDTHETSDVDLEITLGDNTPMRLRDITLTQKIGVKRIGSKLEKDKILMEIIEYKNKLISDGKINAA